MNEKEVFKYDDLMEFYDRGFHILKEMNKRCRSWYDRQEKNGRTKKDGSFSMSVLKTYIFRMRFMKGFQESDIIFIRAYFSAIGAISEYSYVYMKGAMFWDCVDKESQKEDYDVSGLNSDDHLVKYGKFGYYVLDGEPVYGVKFSNIPFPCTPKYLKVADYSYSTDYTDFFVDVEKFVKYGGEYQNLLRERIVRYAGTLPEAFFSYCDINIFATGGIIDILDEKKKSVHNMLWKHSRIVW